MGQRTIGIDLAIRGDHVARIFDDGRPHARPIRFRLTSDSLSSLVKRLRDGLPPESTITAVMEPTGMSWFPVACWLEQAGIKAIRVKGQRVRALRRYLSEHTKTDAADAYVLGAIPLFGGVPVDPVYVPNADRHALQRLTRQRERLEEEVTTIKRRLIDLVRWASPAIEDVLPDFRTNLTLAILHDLFNPGDVIRRGARRCSHSLPSTPAATTLIPARLPTNWWAASKPPRSRRNASMEAGSTSNFCNWKSRSRSIECAYWKTNLANWAAKSKKLYNKLHPSDALRTIQGIGDALAPLILGVLHEARRFAGLHQLRGFCGLFPRTNSSGGTDRPGQSITQSGNNRIKRALYLAADAARRIDPGLAEVYWRLMVRKGHHHKQALCAVATRLVNRIGKVLRTGQPYELRDSAGKSINIAEGRAIIAERFTIPAEIRNVRRKHRAESAA